MAEDTAREYDRASQATDDMLRESFHAMPPQMQRQMLAMLALDEERTPQFWLDVLKPEL